MPPVAGLPVRELLLARLAMVAFVFAWAAVPSIADPAGATTAPWPAAAAVGAAWLAACLPLLRASGRGLAPAPSAGRHLLWDVAALSALLSVFGGATNPFTALYFVPVALATHLSPRWTAAVAAAAVAGFGVLLALSTPMATRDDTMTHHLRGMALAFACAGSLVAVFMHRIAVALARQRERLRVLERAHLEDRHAAALGTLAAGAAHELSTPLGTIELLVSDLAGMAPADRDEAIATIRAQVRRCRRIVEDMASPELVITGTRDEIAPFRPTDLAPPLEELAPSGVVEVTITPAAKDARVVQPIRIVTRQLRELVENALRALPQPPPRGSVRVRLDVAGDRFVATVADRGHGMRDEDLAHAFDPFFHRRPDGSGTGLGLFLIRAQLRRMGGSIALSPNPGGGTLVEVTWPARPDHDPAP